MSATPKTDAKVASSEGYGGHWVPADFARELETKNAKLRAALEFIVKHGGMTHDTECGQIQCTGFWCAEQARAALSN